MTPSEQWAEACEKASRQVEVSHFEVQGDVAIEMALCLLGLAHTLKGVACRHCQGQGRRAYASTAGWRGGIGGQAITDDVCDRCWGTGRSDQTGPDLRRMTDQSRYLDNINKTMELRPEQNSLVRIRELMKVLADTQRLVARLRAWTREFGKELCPGTRPDTYGEGVREAKATVARILGGEK